MRTILYKTLIYLIIVAGIITILNKTVPNSGYSEKVKIDSILKNKDEIMSLTFGRSHASALDYFYWNKSGVNMALGGRDIVSIEYLLDFFVSELNNLDEVIIFISYSSLYYDNTSLSKGNLNDARKTLYYATPSFRFISKNDINNFIFGKYLPFIQSRHGWRFIKQYLQTDDTASSVLSWQNWNDIYMSKTDMHKSSEIQASIHSRDRQLSLNYNKNIIFENSNTLRRICELSKENNIRLVFVTSPYYYEYTVNFPKSDIDEMKSIIYEISKEYSVEYYDFSVDSLLIHDNLLYHNADHLNNRGKELFTKKLLEKINKKYN